MKLFFALKKENEVTETFLIEEGFVIGRTQGQIRLRDTKISSRHAHIEKNEKHELVLVDDRSSNGLLVDNKKVQRVLLKEGLMVQLGTTKLYVIREEKPWPEILKEKLDPLHFEFQAPEIEPFDPPVLLTFIQGIQAGETWILGYGKRVIGSKSIDLTLYEPQAPDICFELVPQKEACLFKTSHPDQILLNKKSISSDTLSEGDVISIHNTLIKVSFIPDAV